MKTQHSLFSRTKIANAGIPLHWTTYGNDIRAVFVRTALAAALYYKHNLTQNHIAYILSNSRPNVSYALRRHNRFLRNNNEPYIEFYNHIIDKLSKIA